MIKKLALLAVAALLLMPAAAQAQHKFKWTHPKTLVNYSQNPENPDIAWDGHNFGIVYDNFYYNNASSAVYLILVNTDGNVVKGPIKISSKKYAFYAKIVWTGNTYGILYGAGTKVGTQWSLRYYLARYNSSGNKLGERELTGDSDYYYYTRHSKLIWTGSEFAIFYYADPDKQSTYASEYPIFCKADANGNPGPVLAQYQNLFDSFDAIWNGKEFLVVGADAFRGYVSEGVVQVLVLDKDGAIKQRKTVIGFAQMNNCEGTSITQIKGKKYLVAVGNYRPEGAPATAAYNKTGDVYSSMIKVKKKSISGLDPKNVTKHEGENWISPKIYRVGKTNYLFATCGSGCSYAFAKISDNGTITSNPLHYDYGG